MKKVFLLAVAASISAGTLFAQATPAKKVKKEKKAKTEKLATPVTPTQAAAPPPPPPVAQQAAAPVGDVSAIFSFKNDNYDFGKIVAGKPVEYDLFIKNISKEEAVVTAVNVTCGCTTPKYEQGKKIAPGETYKVTLGFNGGAPGVASTYSKTVNLVLNGNLNKAVTFRCETYAAPAEGAPTNSATDVLKPNKQ